ncbi:MAG TPA: DUF4962 domain-containing protein [Firmicutes bacterium]|nr:DUF4962 domain-containing protein [Bacillota bacterium]
MQHKTRLILILLLMSIGAMSVVANAADTVIFSTSFEDGTEAWPAGWTSFAGDTMERTAEEARTGNYSFVVHDASSESTIGLRSPHVPVEPGVSYTAETWVLNKQGTAQLYLEFWDDKNVRVDVAFLGTGVSTEWVPIEITRVAPTDAKTATVILYGHRANVGVAYFDDVQIYAESGQNLAMNLESLPTIQMLQPIAPQYTERPKAAGRTFTALVEGHPRLRFSAEELVALQQKVAAKVVGFGVNYAVAADQLRQSADNYYRATGITASYYGGYTVTYPLPVRQPAYRENPPGFTAGRYPYWTALGNQIGIRLQTLSLAYAITGQQRFADKAKEEMLTVCGWNVWSDPSYNCGGKTCLDTGYIVEGVALAYDILYAQLSPAEREQVRTALVQKGLHPLFEDTNQRVDHNIHMVRTAALGVGALALLGEVPNMEAYIYRAYENFIWYLDQRLDSGQTEGMLYTSVAMDHIMHFANALERVTGDAGMFDHPWVKEVLPRWIIYFLAPGARDLVNFSDSNLAIYLTATMAALGRVNKNEQANWYLQTTAGGSAELRLLQLDPDGKATPPDDWPTSAVFADIGWTALRSGWSSRDTLLAFNSSGSKMGHNHFDQNHFVLNVRGNWLIKDPGYQDYNAGPKNEATNQTLGHNALLVNGRGQTVKGGGKTIAAFLTPSFDYVAGDATNAYNGTPKWVRQFIYNKPDYFLMLDEVLLRRAGDTPEFLLHQGAAVSVAGKTAHVGYSAPVSRFTIGSAVTAVDIQIIHPAQVNMTIAEIAGATEYGPYISLIPQVDDERVHMLTLLTPLGFQQAPPKVSQVSADERRVRFQLDWEDRTDYLWIGLTNPGKEHPVYSGALNVIYTDALHAMAGVNAAGEITEYAAIDCRGLYLGETELLQSPVNVAVAVVKDDTGAWTADICTDEAAVVQVWLPAEGDQAGRWINLQVQPGRNSFTLTR